MKEKDREFHDRIEESVNWLKRSRSRAREFWRYVYRLTVIGWLLVLPIVGGAYLGRYLDSLSSSGVSWTITFIITGIAAGIYNIWRFIFTRRG